MFPLSIHWRANAVHQKPTIIIMFIVFRLYWHYEFIVHQVALFTVRMLDIVRNSEHCKYMRISGPLYSVIKICADVFV